MDAWPPSWLAARAGLLAFGLLITVVAGAVSADEPALAALLTPLDLRGEPAPGPAAQ